MAERLKIVFMGTPDFAVEPLRSLLQEGFDIVGVVTAVDKPAGRGKKLKESAVKRFAVENNLNVLQPTNLKNEEFQSKLKSLNADLFVVVAFRMLPEAVWSMPAKGTINLHASLLPNYRGAAPINWAIINGEIETGVTTFFIEKQIDTGDIIFQDRVRILPDMTAGELHNKLSEVGSKLICKTAKVLEKGIVKSIPQNIQNAKTSKAPKIFKEDCQINWAASYCDIYNFIRGLSPYPSAWSTLKADNDIVIKIIEADIETEKHSVNPGYISTDNKKYLKVAAKDGWIVFKKIVPQGKKEMDIRSFLNGFEIKNQFYFK